MCLFKQESVRITDHLRKIFNKYFCHYSVFYEEGNYVVIEILITMKEMSTGEVTKEISRNKSGFLKVFWERLFRLVLLLALKI